MNIICACVCSESAFYSPVSLFLTHFRCMVIIHLELKTFFTSSISRVIVAPLPYVLYAVSMQESFLKTVVLTK